MCYVCMCKCNSSEYKCNSFELFKQIKKAESNAFELFYNDSKYRTPKTA